MEKINVIVNGLPGQIAWRVAEAVCQSSDMKLVTSSLSEPDIVNRHFKVSCTYVEMFNLERKALLFEKTSADIIVDCFLSGDKKEINENRELYLKNKIPFILLLDEKMDIGRLLDDIRVIYQNKKVFETSM